MSPLGMIAVESWLFNKHSMGSRLTINYNQFYLNLGNGLIENIENSKSKKP